jgi:osmotically-inducible protein OsmY
MQDQVLMDEVKAELEFDPQVDADHIGVSAKNGAVTLSGFAASYPEKWAAVRSTERVYGVRAIADDINVRIPDAYHHDDTEISEALQRSMDNNIDVPTGVQAEVRNSVVTLRGEVDWYYQRSEAERLTRHIYGVSDVVDLVTVKPKTSAPDVEKRVSAALRRSADLDARSIWVTSDNGTVHLHGHVHSIREKQTAGDAAFAAAGVSAVDNQIMIYP